ncbi:MAG: dephospho-CoA kinase [Flavobacteriales bacterium]
MRKKTIVGVTGGIGSGKTTICKALEKMGYPVFYSDQAGRTLLKENEDLKTEIKTIFGSVVFNSNNEIERKVLGEIVFKDPTKLDVLNKMIHPKVKACFENWVNEQHSEIVFKESAILFETNDQSCTFVCHVFADIEVRISRVMQRDGVTKEAVLDRMKNQWTDEQRKEKSHFNISNNNSDLVISQLVSMIYKIENP